MPTVRRVPDADLQQYRRFIDYAFQPEDGPQETPEVPDRLAERYGVYDEQTLLATGALYEFDARLREEWITLGGVAAISTPPEHRGEGYIRQLCRDLLEICRGKDIGLTALWPFSTAFYRQFGWATANKYTVYEAPPAQLATAGTTDHGSYVPIDADDWERLRPAQLGHGDGTTLSLRRSEQFWREHVFEHWGEKPWVYGWERDGEIRGYVVYTFRKDGDDRTLRTIDFSAIDQQARAHLLGFLGSHESQAETVRLYLAAETTLLDAVADPIEVDCSVFAGPMVRISDVESALEACSYPDDVTTSLTFEIRDPLADWIDGRYEVTVADGSATCTTTTDEQDATVDVGTLSQLLVGYRGVEAARGDGLECPAENAHVLEKLFPQAKVCLREFF